MQTTLISFLRNMIRLLQSCYIYLITLFISLLFLPLCYFLSLFPYHWHRTNRAYFFITNIWNKALLNCSGVTLFIKGKENLPAYPTQPSLFIINHTSALDIPLVEYVIGSYPHIWISKKIYGRIPIFGRLLHRMHILIDKKNSRESARSLLKLISRVKHGSRHILIFPEGTRSRSEQLLPFEPGFVFLAQKLQYPIIPIALKNAAKVMSPSSWYVHPRIKPLYITIGKPHALTKDTADETLSKLRTWFEHQLQ